MEKVNKTEQLKVSITPEEKELILKYCADHGDISVSAFVRQAIRKYMAEMQ